MTAHNILLRDEPDSLHPVSRSRVRPWKILIVAIAVLVLAQACSNDDDIVAAPAATAVSPSTTAPEDDPVAAVNALAAGFDGQTALSDVTSYQVTASGTRHLAGEGFDSHEGSELISSFESVVTHDLNTDRLRVDYDRTIHYAADASLIYSEIIDGQVGTIDGVDTLFGRSGVMSSARLASTRKHIRLLYPHLLVQGVIAQPTIATDAGVAELDGIEHRLVEIEDPIYPMTLWIDPATRHITKLTTMENHHVFRDVALEVTYHDWTTSDSAMSYPALVTITKDGELVHEETRSAVQIAPAIGDEFFDFDQATAFPPTPELAAWGETSHQFHQEWSSFGFPLDFLETTIESRELSPGVWFIGGGTYTSMLVEQTDGVVIIESPLYPERSAAVLDWIAAEFPGQPVKAVVSTHHHVDHVGGLREFVAAGATVVASADSEDSFRRIVAAPSTLVPDTLSQYPVDVDFMWVPEGGTVLLDDPVNPVSAVHINTEHAADMVMVHVPSAQLVFNSDLHDPNSASVVGPEAQPEGLLAPSEVRELRDAIEALDAPITTVVGGHGGGGPLADVGVGPVEELDAFLTQFG